MALSSVHRNRDGELLCRLAFRIRHSKQFAVSARHQFLAVLDQTDNTRPEVVALPASIIEVTACQQHLTNRPIGLSLAPGIQGRDFEE